MDKTSLKKAGLALITTAVLSASFLPSVANATSEKYKLNNSVNIYVSADDAKNNRNVRGAYNAGEYYVYRKYGNFLNISKAEGVPGGWISPTDNKVSTLSTEVKQSETVRKEETQTSVLIKNGNKIKVSKTVSIYLSADNAKNKTNVKGTYSAGEYFIFREYNGAYNISKVQGQPGGWVYESTNTSPVVTEIKTEVKTTPVPVKVAETKKVANDDTFTLESSKKGYINAENAKNGYNAVTTLSEGKYFVFKRYDGMLNLTTVKGQPGAWVNPEEVVSKSEVRSYANQVEETELVSSSIGQKIVAEAEKYLGYDYVFGGSSPSTGFDCSGLVKYVIDKVKGTSISRNATAQAYNGGQYVAKSDLQAGDLVFFGGSMDDIWHVGIYDGNGGVIHASDYGVGVIRSSLSSSWYSNNYVTARRY